jgi:glycerol kinase
LGSRQRAIHRAIVWQDRRTASICDQLAADELGPQFLERTGLVVDAYFLEQNVGGFSITFLAHVSVRKRASSHSAPWTRGYLGS